MEHTASSFGSLRLLNAVVKTQSAFIVIIPELVGIVDVHLDVNTSRVSYGVF